MGSVKQSGRMSTSESESAREEIIVGDDVVSHGIRSDSVKELAKLPPNVRRRIMALRVLQKQFIDVEAEFYCEVHELECKYAKLYRPIFEKRAKIVTGAYEPTDEECQLPWNNDVVEGQLAEAIRNTALADKEKKEEETDEPPMDPNAKGIPDFWFTVFKNVCKLDEMMQDHDVPIIKCLQDIKVEMQDDPLGFTLEFHFAPNDYFTNSVLTKQYSLKFKPDEENPLDFEGPEIYACKGCEIDWKKGKNVTVKTIKKKQKHKSRGSVRTVTKTVQTDSFFNFFNPPAMSDEPNSTMATDTQVLLAVDFEVGHYIRERVVARAQLIYTGEAIDEDDDEDEDEDFEEEDEEEESSSEDSDGGAPRSQPRGKKKADSAENPAECKQQ